MRSLASTALLVLSAPLYASDPPSAGSATGVFDSMPSVVAASLHAQTLQEAPANVTVITGQDIRRYGYRTLGEALSHVRGFYTSYDRCYTGAGVRGMLVPGDYNTRFLVMINGHNMTENVYGSNDYFGQDFGLDMDLVERIEIIRGPSSTLYGSNGIFATINIVTRSPAEAGTQVSVETGSFGQKKIFGATSLDLGHGANLLIGGSLYGSAGADLYFPEFDSAGTNFGRANGVDGEHAYHTFANLVYGGWSLTAYFNSRWKSDPTAPYGTVFNTDSAIDIDTRDFLELGYVKETGNGTWHWRLYYDRYQYEGHWKYAESEGVQQQRDYALGSYVGTQLTYRRDLAPRLGAVTVGVEAVAGLNAIQRYYPEEAGAPSLDIDTPDRSAAIFLQHEYNLTPRTQLTWGTRLDGLGASRLFLSPRVALIRQQSKNTTFKLMYGRAFRNPTSYERFYADGISQLPSPDLRPESGNTIELDVERKMGDRMLVTAGAYRYSLNQLITASPVTADAVQFVNSGRASARGLELEVSGRPYRALQAGMSVAIQKFTDNRSSAPAPNSPTRLWKARIGAPLQRKVFAGLEFRQTSQRYTLGGNRLPPFHLLDATVSTARLSARFDIVAGVRNLLGCSYADPASFGHEMDAIAQDGRSWFVKVVWHNGD